MDYAIGIGTFLFGAAFAFFIEGNSGAGWIVLGTLAVYVFVLTAHLTGVRKGEKRVSDL